MEPKFEVDLDINQYFDGEIEQQITVLEDVKPKSLSAECPHCGVYAAMSLDSVVTREPGWKFDLICSCPNCRQSLFAQGEYSDYDPDEDSKVSRVLALYPEFQPVNLPPEIPDKYRGDYREAILIKKISPKASAALSRRILQNIIREEFGIKHRSLAQEIDDFIKLPNVPSYLSSAVDAIRNIGNFAAHPLKDSRTGEIVDVEPGEAEWLIEVLDSLCDFAFVQPEKLKKRKEALNNKLQSMGKPPMKS